MSEDPVDLAAALAPADHGDHYGWAVEQPKETGSAAVRDDRARAAGQRSRLHSSWLPDRRVANRVDATEDPMQKARSNEVLDSALADAKSAHLPPGDHPVLVCRQSRQFQGPRTPTFACHVSKSRSAN